MAAAQRAGLLAACHDCSDGGLAVAVAEMAIAGGSAARIELANVPLQSAGSAANGSALHSDLTIAFTETPGRFVCEVPAAVVDRFAAHMNQIPPSHTEHVPWAWIGEVIAGSELEIVSTTGTIAAVPLAMSSP